MGKLEKHREKEVKALKDKARIEVASQAMVDALNKIAIIKNAKGEPHAAAKIAIKALAVYRDGLDEYVMVKKVKEPKVEEPKTKEPKEKAVEV